MKLTRLEQKICEQHHTDAEGIVRCESCPLVIDAFSCKATVSRKEFEKVMKEQAKESKQRIKEIRKHIKELKRTD